MYDQALENEIVAKINGICRRAKVLKVESHFAGYFDELGITVILENDASDKAFRKLALKIMDYLNSTLPEGNEFFTWQLFFVRSEKQIGIFFPGDSFEDNCANA